MSRIPMIALIGLPNSGKSTLLNKVSGTRKAIVAKEAHTTRDLNYAESEWDDMYMRFVDTGGLVPDTDDKIQKQIQVKSWSAIAQSDLLVWVIDRKQNPDTISDRILQKVWKSGKDVIIAINKVDDPNQDAGIAEYARLGGVGFVNMSATNSYGINDLLDQIVEYLQEKGFQKGTAPKVYIPPEEPKKKKSKSKEVRLGKDGKYHVIKDTDEDSAAMFKAFQDEEVIINPIDAIVLHPQYFTTKNEETGEVELHSEYIQQLRELSLPCDIYTSGIVETDVYKVLSKSFAELSKVCRGVILYEQDDREQPLSVVFDKLEEEYRIKRQETVYFDSDEDAVHSARKAGLWAEVIEGEDVEELDTVIESIQRGDIDRVPHIPKLLLLGRPNVGKSSLFNVLAGQEVQIVTDIPGTTLSVNDMLLERDIEDEETGETEKKRYILLDSTGVRKPGQRTFGAETFATYRTVQSAHDADVVCLMLDGSVPVSHQDQVVAGIAHEAHKGIVVIVNKTDLMDQDRRKRFQYEFVRKFQFLKVESFVFISALQKKGIDDIWDAIDDVLARRKQRIDATELRKLFNYLMKKKQPTKMRLKKRAVIYDLVCTKNNPPTFELLVKDPETIHWSYKRFLENILRKQFNLGSTGLTVKITKVQRKFVEK